MKILFRIDFHCSLSTEEQMIVFLLDRPYQRDKREIIIVSITTIIIWYR